MAEGKQKRLIDRILSRERDIKLIQYPGTEENVGLMLLNCSELQESHFTARKWFAKKCQEVDDTSHIQFLAEEEIQQCFSFLIDPDSGNGVDKLFASDKEARKRLGVEERAYFIDQYSAFLNEKIKGWNLDPDKSKDKSS